VSSDPDEAVYLSHRVYVATQRPMRIAGVIDVDLPSERHHDVTLTSSFAAQKRALLSLLRDAPIPS